MSKLGLVDNHLGDQFLSDIRSIMRDHRDDWEEIRDHLLSLYDFALKQGLPHEDWIVIVNRVNKDITQKISFEPWSKSA